MENNYPILEFDSDTESIVKPSAIQPPDFPQHCVLLLSSGALSGLIKRLVVTHLLDIKTWMGQVPIYKIDYNGCSIAVVSPGLTAPYCVAVMEEIIAHGCSKLLALGFSCTLHKSISRRTVVVPNAAIRDEGTSYHYVAPSREINVSKNVIEVIEYVLKKHNVKYLIGKTWTTDGLFRETKFKIARRRDEGCLTGEMECASMLAVAQFRNVKFGHLLAITDDISGEKWDSRESEEAFSLQRDLFPLAVEASSMF